MDPFTQGVVGAAFGQLKGSAQTLAKAAIIGALAGMAADLDILIRSSEDPLLALQFHRHFSHSLLFIPIGALLCAVFFHYAFAHRRWGFSFNQTYSWSLIGYATHALLDGCTSYGTQLLWPLTNHRFAWDFIAVIDPAFTLPAFILVLTTAIKKQRRWALMAIAWMAVYMVLAGWQHQRALAQVHALAAQRGHTPERISAKPTLGNLVLWKTLYLHQGAFYINGIKVGLFGKNAVWQGESVPALIVARDFPELAPHSQQLRDIQRFHWFSDGYTALDPNNNQRIIDLRYSILPHKSTPLWAIEIDPSKGHTEHVKYIPANHGDPATGAIFFKLLFE